MVNLLETPCLRGTSLDAPVQDYTLPGLIAALLRADVFAFPGLRPFQAPAWHMFLTQLAALALHRADEDLPPQDEAAWKVLLRGLTPDYPNDEPWTLIVADAGMPAFLQPPVPAGVVLKGEAETPDALDVLQTSKNHEIKTRLDAAPHPDRWIYALVNLQTCEGFNGSGNYGIARMNGGSSSRMCFGLSPMTQAGPAGLAIDPGLRLRHDLNVLIHQRMQQIAKHDFYPPKDGIGLVWTQDWPDTKTSGLDVKNLDIWFIEVCRRVRLTREGDMIRARTGTSKAPRIDAAALKGATGDPWALIASEEMKSLTLGESPLSYKRLHDFLIAGQDWTAPLSLTPPSDVESGHEGPWALIIQGLGRGNSKTFGYRERVIPMPGDKLPFFLTKDRQKELREVSQSLIEAASDVSKALRSAIRRAGSSETPLAPWTERLDTAADALFFPALWTLLDQTGEDRGKQRDLFAQDLAKIALRLLEDALSQVVGTAIDRYEKNVGAYGVFYGSLRKKFPDLSFSRHRLEVDPADDAA